MKHSWHSLERGWTSPAGTQPGFAYPEALRAAARDRALVWTRATLDAFLADPGVFIDGTAMTQNLPIPPTGRT